MNKYFVTICPEKTEEAGSVSVVVVVVVAVVVVAVVVVAVVCMSNNQSFLGAPSGHECHDCYIVITGDHC